MDYEATEASPPEEPNTTFFYQDTRTGEYEEVNAAHVEFTRHHAVFRDMAGTIKHAVLAEFVDDMVQQVAA